MGSATLLLVTSCTGSLRPTRRSRGGHHEASARSIVTAVALAALSVLPVGGAYADPADDQRGVQSCSGPADRTRACQALQRTLAREPHTYPAASASPQHANPSGTPMILAVTGAVGLSVVVVVAVASSRRRQRARSRPQEAT
jgi:hypothetical protein